MTVFVALNGPNDDGRKPKAPSTRGWESPTHKGINPKSYAGWYGLRCDGLIVIDCDSAEANDFWIERTHPHRTWTRKTPRGFHHIYRWHDPLGEMDELKGPHAGVLDGIDVRQGRSSQIVYSAGPGMYDTIMGGPSTALEFHPPWAADFVVGKRANTAAETWDEMPEGVGNNTMAAIAGTMRKQGMSPYTMVRCLAAINRITMTSDPMPRQMIVDIAKSVSRYDVDPVIDEIEYNESDA